MFDPFSVAVDVELSDEGKMFGFCVFPGISGYGTSGVVCGWKVCLIVEGCLVECRSVEMKHRLNEIKEIKLIKSIPSQLQILIHVCFNGVSSILHLESDFPTDGIEGVIRTAIILNFYNLH